MDSKIQVREHKKVKLENKYFHPPENLKAMLDESVNIWFNEKRDKKVVLKVEKSAAKYFKQKACFLLQNIKKQNKDGSLTVETTVCQYEEIIPIILQWIPYAKVIAPKELCEEIKQKIHNYIHNNLC